MNKLNLMATVVTGLAISFSVNAQSFSKVNGSVTIADGQSADSISSVNGTISIGKNATIRDDISVVNGTVSVGAASKLSDVSTVNGEVSIGENSTVGEITVVNGEINLARNVHVKDDITSVNGGILSNAQTVIDGDVTSVNGAIGLIATNVKGRVENVNGNTTIGVNSSVGSVRYIKPKGFSIGLNNTSKKIPRVIIGPNATVRGDLNFEREVKLYVHSTAKVGTITGATAIPYNGDTAPKN